MRLVGWSKDVQKSVFIPHNLFKHQVEDFKHLAAGSLAVDHRLRQVICSCAASVDSSNRELHQSKRYRLCLEPFLEPPRPPSTYLVPGA